MNSSLIPHNSHIIIGFSGGPDSVYLLLALKNIAQSYNLTLIAAHLDHEWRQESGEEAEWCKNFCKQYDIAFISQKASEMATTHKYNGSKEEHARELRRAFFATVAQQYQHAYVALAHHQDDQIETFFIRLARGTSVTGLTGIKEQEGIYLRPLLQMKKRDILEYLTHRNITFLQDPTNHDDTFLRNRIRNHINPQLTEIDQRLPGNIITTMQHLSDVDIFLNQQTNKALQSLTASTDPLKINIPQFLEQNQLIQHRIILQMLIKAQASFTPSQGLFKEIIKFLKSHKSNQHTIHTTYKVIKEKKSFFIA